MASDLAMLGGITRGIDVSMKRRVRKLEREIQGEKAFARGGGGQAPENERRCIFCWRPYQKRHDFRRNEALASQNLHEIDSMSKHAISSKKWRGSCHLAFH